MSNVPSRGRLGASLAVILWFVSAGAAHAAAERRTLRESFALAPGQSVSIDFPVGELEISTFDGDAVEVEIRARCKRASESCARRVASLALESSASPARRGVRVTGFPKWRSQGLELEGTIRVPRQRAVSVDMGIGRLTVEGAGGDLSVDLGIGELEIRGAQEAFASARLDAGIGEASLRTSEGSPRARRSLLVGSNVRWSDGRGNAALRADVGIGAVLVRLD